MSTILYCEIGMKPYLTLHHPMNARHYYREQMWRGGRDTKRPLCHGLPHKAAQRYCALGPAANIAECMRAFYAAGARLIVLDLLGPYELRQAQIERVAAEVLPLLTDLTGTDRLAAAREKQELD